MFLEAILKVMLVFGPEFPIRVHNKLQQLPSRIAYMDLGIVPLASSAFFFLLTHCFPELITIFTIACRGDLSGLPIFLFLLRFLQFFNQGVGNAYGIVGNIGY